MAKSAIKHASNAEAVKIFLDSRYIYNGSYTIGYMYCTVKYRYGDYVSTEGMKVTITYAKDDNDNIRDDYGNIKIEGYPSIYEYPMKFSAKMATYKYEQDKLIIYSTRNGKKVIVEIGENDKSMEDNY